MSRMEEEYLNSSVVMKGDYPYFINAISDGNPPVTKELMDEFVDRVLEKTDIDCDVILAPEAMAIQYATALTVRTGVPFQIIRKRKQGLPGEIVFDQSTGYSKSQMYINFLKSGTRVVIVDDVLSTGGTMRAIVNELRRNGIIVEKAIIVLNKSNDAQSLAKELGIELVTLLDVAVKDGKPVLRD